MNIVVTGASKGIGFELVSELSRNPDLRVIALSRDESRLRLLLDGSANPHNKNIHILPFDISDFNKQEFISHKNSDHEITVFKSIKK